MFLIAFAPFEISIFYKLHNLVEVSINISLFILPNSWYVVIQNNVSDSFCTFRKKFLSILQPVVLFCLGTEGLSTETAHLWSKLELIYQIR